MTPELNFKRRTFLKGASVATSLGAFGMPAMALLPDDWIPSVKTPTLVVGCGRQGRAILSQLTELGAAEVVAIAERVESRQRAGLRKAPDAKLYADMTEALDAHPEVQAVILATASHEHAALAIEALGRHLAVYCEAPMATTEQDLAAILEAAENSLGLFHCGLQARSNPLYAHARDFLRSAAILDPVSYRAQHHDKQTWVSPARDPKDQAALNWRLDPAVSLGLAGEWGVHQFDVFHWFLGEYPTDVRGQGSIQLHDDGREVHDTVQLELSFKNDRKLLWEGTLANSFEKNYELFHGTAGAIKLAQDAGWLFKEVDAPTLGFEVYAGRQHFHNEEGITLVVDATQLAAQERLKEGVGLKKPPLYFALEAYYKSIQEAAPVACDAPEGARAARVAIAASQAVRSGETVAIEVEPS